MATDRKPVALAWLARIHRELKPNASLDQFINSLRLNSYGDDVIPEKDFQEWLQSKGEIIMLSASVADKVRNAIVVKYTSNKNWLPTRKTIDSAFINLATAAWGYLDASKVVALQVINSGKLMADAAGKLTYAVTNSATSLAGVSKYLWYPLGVFVVYFLWTNRSALSSALGEKAVSKIRSKSNPRRRSKKYRAKKRATQALSME